MPELCEVEVIRKELARLFLNSKILDVKVVDPRLRFPLTPHYEQSIKNGKILNIKRHGKYLFWEIEGAKSSEVLFHLGMTGRLLWQENPLWQKHLRIVYELSLGKIYFYDTRRFGFTFCGENLLENLNLGQDALSISYKDFCHLFGFLGSVKSLLLDQKKIAGIGNIYASEILHKAKVHPAKKAKELSFKEIKNLYYAMKSVLKKSIKKKGSSIKDFYYGPAKKGSFQNHFAVYDREKKPCFSCGTPIVRINYLGRSTYFCPVCQPNFE